MALEAARVSPPQEVYVLGNSTSSQSMKLERKLYKGWITVDADGDDVWVKFTVGTSGGTADETATSGTDSDGYHTPATNGVVKVPQDFSRHFDLRELGVEYTGPMAIFMDFISSAGSGQTRVYKSSGPKGK